MSQHGIDVFALKIKEEEITEICFIESKVRTSKDLQILIKSLKQLDDYYKTRLTDWNSFCIQYLSSTNSQYFKPFKKYLKNRDNNNDIDSFKISLCINKEIWDDRILENFIDSGEDLQNLDIIIIRIKNLACLIKYIYEKKCNLEVCNKDGE